MKLSTPRFENYLNISTNWYLNRAIFEISACTRLILTKQLRKRFQQIKPLIPVKHSVKEVEKMCYTSYSQQNSIERMYQN
jgi:hypothetical protein